MDVALLNVRITIQKNETIVDSIGNHKNVWSDYYSCFATVSGEGGSEKSVAGLIVEDSDISFTIRFCEKVKNLDATKFRVVLNDEIYNIAAIDHMNFKRKCLKLKCIRNSR